MKQEISLKKNKKLFGLGKRLGALKIGEYGVYVHEREGHEAAIEGIKEGDVFYTVRLDKESWVDVINHSEAILLSKLTSLEVSIEELKNGNR